MNEEVKRLKRVLYFKFYRNILLFSVPLVFFAIWVPYNSEMFLLISFITALSATLFFAQSKKYIQYLETFNDNICRIDMDGLFLKTTFIKFEDMPKFLVFSTYFIVPKGVEFELDFAVRRHPAKMVKAVFNTDYVVMEKEIGGRREDYKYVVK